VKAAVGQRRASEGQSRAMPKVLRTRQSVEAQPSAFGSVGSVGVATAKGFIPRYPTSGTAGQRGLGSDSDRLPLGFGSVHEILEPVIRCTSGVGAQRSEGGEVRA